MTPKGKALASKLIKATRVAAKNNKEPLPVNNKKNLNGAPYNN